MIFFNIVVFSMIKRTNVEIFTECIYLSGIFRLVFILWKKAFAKNYVIAVLLIYLKKQIRKVLCFVV